jgi:hypothetical protein
MSTKSTFKHEHDPATGRGFSLYTDWLDDCIGDDVVHLRLEGVSFEATADASGPAVTVSLPRDMAERLGLIQPPEHIVIDLEAGTAPGEPLPVMFTGPNLAACEQWIADEAQRNPDKVHRGGFGID